MTMSEQLEQAGWTGTGGTASMSLWQFLAAAVCVLVNVLDGFDILIMSVAAPSIGADLGLSTAQIGLMFSSGLTGMMFGALLLAPLADHFGRRVMVLVCLAINIIGMFSTGLSQNLPELSFSRFVTGLGVGGMMPIVNTAIAEVVNERSRNMAVVIQAAAYPLGGLLAALIWAPMIQGHTWHQIIQAACLPSVLCFGLVLLLLPESLPFLLARRPANALQQINKTLRRFGQPTLGVLPPAAARRRASRVGIIFEKDVRRNVTALAAATFLTQFSFYFFLSWIPVVMSSALAAGNVQRSGPVLLNLGGIAGDFLFAGLTVWISVRRLTAATMLLAFMSIGALGLCLNRPVLTGSIAAIVGATLFASMAGIYSIAPRVFPTLNRAAGTGVAFSVGRLGGALSPWLGALALRAPGGSLETTLLVMAAPLVVAAVALGFLRPVLSNGDYRSG